MQGETTNAEGAEAPEAHSVNGSSAAADGARSAEARAAEAPKPNHLGFLASLTQPKTLAALGLLSLLNIPTGIYQAITARRNSDSNQEVVAFDRRAKQPHLSVKSAQFMEG